ncbi:MAG: hypothetical protein AAFQ07_01805, partial [Chloroflexota bacterium]
MQIPFLRGDNDVPEELNLYADSLLEDTTNIVTNWQEAVVSNMPAVQSDPVRKAAHLRVGMVSVDEKPRLPMLLGDATQTDMLQFICLPRNPRIADNELYEIDGMDYIVV